MVKRRKFIIATGQVALGLGVLGLGACSNKNAMTNEEGDNNENTIAAGDLFFDISLAEWSLHRTIREGKLDHLDFAKTAREKFDIGGIEYVNAFFKDKAEVKAYLDEMNQRAADFDVKQLLIMIDGEGNLGTPNATERLKAVENHYKWVEAAKHLDCHSIRVNAYGEGTKEEVAKAAVDGLSRLSDFAKDYNINVLVENHGTYSSIGTWLAGVMKNVNKDNCGTLPDFGNFCVKWAQNAEGGQDCEEEYDRYKGVAEMMPYAMAVSAKSHDFDDNGNAINIDYEKMLKIVRDHNYTGYIGIEYEGNKLDEMAGIEATKKLLIDVGQKLS